MLDHSSSSVSNIHHTPEAATLQPPVRIEAGGKAYWIRPSNVLRVVPAHHQYGAELRIVFSDGQFLQLDKEAGLTVDSVAALLWPAGAV